jgi:hypothetical protein
MDLLSFELVDLDPDPDPHKMNAGSETAVKKAKRIYDENFCCPFLPEGAEAIYILTH